MTHEYNGVRFSDEDVVNLGDWIPHGEYNPHNVRPFLLHDHGFVLALVFASDLQDALDIAVDAGKLDDFLIAEEDYDEYGINGEEPTCDFLGNASEPFDIENVDYFELPNPDPSFVAQFAASIGETVR